MQIVFETKQVKLSVGEFARFDLAPSFNDSGSRSQWRMEVGRQWHDQLQNAPITAAPTESEISRQCEVSISARWSLDGWTALLRGRIDEVWTQPEKRQLREIKTVRRTLPVDPDELRDAYPTYFAQLSIYLELLRKHPAWNDRPLYGTLVFVDMDEGFIQEVALDEGEASWRILEQTLKLSRFVQLRQSTQKALGEMPPVAPFVEWRSGQADVPDLLRQVSEKARTVLFEAPTGFGKTGIALAHGIDALRSGLVSRIVFLTGKSSGQTPVTSQLQRMLGSETELRYLQMRNRSELSLPDDQTRLISRRDMQQSWNAAGLRLEDLFEEATVTPERLLATGERLNVDPYAIAKALLPLADIWIGDYNYLFSPSASSVFEDAIGFNPAETLLIVDEAHNLPSRSASGWSHSFSASNWHLFATELAAGDIDKKFLRDLREWADSLDHLSHCDALTEAQAIEAQLLLGRCSKHIQTGRIAWEQVPPLLIDQLWSLPAALQSLENTLLPFLSWSPRNGQWSLTCLDAAAEVGPVIERFGHSILMSATLQPYPEISRMIGLPAPGSEQSIGHVCSLEAETPWRAGAYRVAVDARVDTRFRARAQSVPTTAETVIDLCQGQPQPIAVFFSSYRYAEEVARQIEWQSAWTKVAMQPRGLDLRQQNEFIEQSLLTAHALFLVLGSSFAEGVDSLGGRVTRAMVVGPALPEVNSVEEARRTALSESGHPDAFRAVYQVPGMQRIQQAIGRLVRAPGHSADILLHGNRFAQKSYQTLFPAEWADPHIIRTTQAFADWLSEAN